MAGKVGLEPTTYQLTADCSTIELPANIGGGVGIEAKSGQVPVQHGFSFPSTPVSPLYICRAGGRGNNMTPAEEYS